MSSPLSTNQRRQLYELALKELADTHMHLCPLMRDTIRVKMGVHIIPSELGTFFPELALHRPRGITPAHSWWPENEAGRQKRIDVIKDCIRRTTLIP